ncbi:hypothetical protein DOY81_008736 [Sarcophaga bullata]|nr:hypothetical protein DOY81_008736 [Sarcophaga bullata]
MLKFYLQRIIFLLLIIFNDTQQYFDVPSVPCPIYFQYFVENSQYYGRIQIPAVSNSIELTISLTQRQPLQTNYYGRIKLESRRDPIIYRVEFPSFEVPKLTRITVNGQDICIGNGYPPPMTRLFLSLSAFPQTPSQQFPGFNPPSVQSNFPSNDVQFGPPTPALNDKFNTQFQPAVQSNQCGMSTSVSPLVYGGQEVTRGEFPWLTAIYQKSAGLKFMCGGSLLSSRTVLSAGHCFKINSLAANRLVVYIGHHNLEDFSEQGFVTREIENLIVHPQYNPNLLADADLAVLHLREPVQFSNFIRPICLWTESTDISYLVGKSGVVAGWGADEQGRNFVPVPKKVDTKIVSEGECLRSSSIYQRLTSSRTICAGNRDETGPCKGDSGSGLMINNNGRWFLRGIVSNGQTKGLGCNLQEFVVFCDVSQHLPWLRNNLV